MTGTATWYCLEFVSKCPVIHRNGMYGAAGPGLRDAIGEDWRGTEVLVCREQTCISVKLIDWCLCRDDRIVDLFSEAFEKLSPLSRGVIGVTVSWK